MKFFFFLLLFQIGFATHILVGSPVRQKPAILKEFLASLERLEKKSFSLDYFFIDDNEDPNSSALLEQFAKKYPTHLVKAKPTDQKYLCNEVTHFWKEELIWKVAGFKDQIIERAKEKGYDYLFLIDSDIVLQPVTIEKLLRDQKEIVSNVFWTKWQPDQPSLPQVWLSDTYNLFELKGGETLSQEEAQRRSLVFLKKLQTPGVYEVGGLGACTLISRSALEKGISFKKIKNITFWGEDRHFCVRAAALGIGLYVDTHYPAYHIYREENLSGVAQFVREAQSTLPPRITLSMCMRNEADHYLEPMLKSAKEYITDAVIIDDASTDNSVALAEKVLEGIPYKIVKNQTSKFATEYLLRQQQWEETLKTHPEWIVFLDADQMFEKRFKHEVKQLLLDPEAEVYYFRLYDFWDKSHYREDSLWFAHTLYRPFLLKYKPGVHYEWRETNQHCGSFPYTIASFKGKKSELRVKHFGWATPEDRMAKYHRYKQLDPKGIYGSKIQYESILDTNPNLIAWIE
jgi:glycosyltransferase involved in cell wall biosynthesis